MARNAKDFYVFPNFRRPSRNTPARIRAAHTGPPSAKRWNTGINFRKAPGPLRTGKIKNARRHRIVPSVNRSSSLSRRQATSECVRPCSWNLRVSVALAPSVGATIRAALTWPSSARDVFYYGRPRNIVNQKAPAVVEALASSGKPQRFAERPLARAVAVQPPERVLHGP